MDALLAAGADIDAGQFFTPLMHAAESGSVAIVERLVAAGADLNACTMHGTALHQAVEQNRPDVAAVLVQAGADRTLKDDEGCTPLDLARQHRRKRVVALLETAAPSQQPVPARKPPRRQDR